MIDVNVTYKSKKRIGQLPKKKPVIQQKHKGKLSLSQKSKIIAAANHSLSRTRGKYS